MSFFEVLKIRIKYRDEMKLWEDQLRKGITCRIEKAFLGWEMDEKTFSEAFNESSPVLLGREVAEIKARVATKSKINVR